MLKANPSASRGSSVAIPMATSHKRPHRSEDVTGSTEKHSIQDHAISYKTWGKSRSLRLKYFDYASPGIAYHITIGTNQGQSMLTTITINQQIINTLKNSTELLWIYITRLLSHARPSSYFNPGRGEPQRPQEICAGI